MKLLKLKLKNFKGERDFTLDTMGGNVAVFGDNGTGKTTLQDAFFWLLFDKDSQGKKDFAIKTLDANNKVIPGLDHEVEGVFEVGGKQLTLRKVYAENWTKKRGSATKTFTGHTIDHFVNGVPVKKGEYDATVNSIAKEDIFKLLTSPTFFNEQLHWQERRKILLDVCGDISDQDVITSDNALSRLPDILQGRKLEDHRKVIAARRAEINKELDKIPVRIDEATKALPDISGIELNKISFQLAELKAQQHERQQELARVQSGGEVAEKRRQMAEVEGDILRLKNDHRSTVDGVINGKYQQLNELLTSKTLTEGEIRNLKAKRDSNNTEITQLDNKCSTLRAAWHEVKDLVFTREIESACPTCGQELPAEQVAEAHEKALSAFNRQKAESLEETSGKGKAAKAELERLQAENLSYDGKIKDAESKLAQVEAEISGIKTEIESLQNQSQPISNNPIYIQKLKEKEQIERAIAELQTGNQEAIQSIKNNIADLGMVISEMEADLQKVKLRETGQRRIEELKAQEKTLAAEFEKLEGELFLCESFVKTKVSLLESKINSKFKYARFQLFEQQINGGISECCNTLYNGVPYSSGLNNGHRGIVGLDIIATLADHYNFYPPIFYDNAESVTRLPEMKGQMITLYVSEKDKVLRVEHENKNLIKEAV